MIFHPSKKLVYGIHRATVDNQGHVSIKGQRMSCGDIDLGSDCFVVGQGDHYEIYRTEEWERVTASEIGGESDQ